MIAPGGDPHKPRPRGFFASTFGTESAYEDNWRQHAKVHVVKDTFLAATGYFLGYGLRKPTAEDIGLTCIECRSFAAALSFFMATDPRVIAQKKTIDKYHTVAMILRELIAKLP